MPPNTQKKPNKTDQYTAKPAPRTAMRWRGYTTLCLACACSHLVQHLLHSAITPPPCRYNHAGHAFPLENAYAMQTDTLHTPVIKQNALYNSQSQLSNQFSGLVTAFLRIQYLVPSKPSRTLTASP